MNDGLRHLGEVLSEPFLSPLSRTYWLGLVLTAVVAVVFFGVHRPQRWSKKNLWAGLRHPSNVLDCQLFLSRQLLRALFSGPAVGGSWWLATRGVRWLDGAWGVPTAPKIDPGLMAVVYTLVLFVAWDASRFILHWLSHRLPLLWAFHQVHHSAEVLTPLTFHRIHPVESWLYDMRGALVTGVVAGGFYWVFRGQISDYQIMGVPALGLLLNVTTGNLRHSPVWIRFPVWLERWLISPAQHQLHHSVDPVDQNSNYGTWLSVWDRLAGSWVSAGEQPPSSYGITASERNHGNHLLSAWFGPLKGVVGLGALLSVTLVSPVSLAADDSEEAPSSEPAPETESEETETEEWDRYGEEMIVYSDTRMPRAAGSAHKVNEETLETFEYNNIEQVVGQIPGVSTRNEDGFGLRPNIGIRGANSDRSAKITLMEDGVLLAPAPYAAPAAYYFPMSTRLVGVEVFKGPSATRHGPFTVGGALNVLTREIPYEKTLVGDVSIGQWNTVKTHAYSGLTGDSTGVLFEGVNVRSDGFKDLDTGGPTGFERSEFMLKSEWLIRADHRLELKLGYATEESNETYLGLSASDWEQSPYRRYAASGLGNMAWNRTQAELEWSGRLGSNVRIRSVAYHHWLDRSWTKLNGFAGGTDLHGLLQQEPGGQGEVLLAILRGEEDSVTPGQLLRIGTNEREFHSYGLQTTARWRMEPRGEHVRSVLEGGVRIHGDHVRRLHTEDPHAMLDGVLEATGTETSTTLDSEATAHALAVHLHEELSIRNFHFFPGARLEVVRGWQEDVGSETTAAITRVTPLPGLGLLWEPGERSDLFVGAHRGFSPVSPGQPESVEPESSWNYELGARFDFGATYGEVVGFYNDYTNITGQCTFSGGCTGDDVDRQFNGGAVQVYGAEVVAGAEVELLGGLSLPVEMSYALTRSAFTTSFVSSFPQFGSVESGESLPYVPEHQAGIRGGIAHPRWSLSAGVAARSGMLDQAGTLDELHIPALWLVDLAAQAQLSKALAIYGTGTNLTGEDAITSWRPFGARPTPPRQLAVGLKGTLGSRR